ncbi:MAG: putative CK1/TTBK protein kinase [Streblomastix strix]|uniref:non-specific serine/threonine protein kinase n=1 Tax=Streblomastix strix TaxID=222440 RepID=A0A5J4TJE5_9EUKA|nr:MAG: putative CK1/TTBK protein kinase [Streblomastix strix]
MDGLSPPAVQVTCKPGDVVKKYYTLLKQIGAGSYGSIFSATYRNGQVQKIVAIKFEMETPEHPFLYNEALMIQTMSGQNHYAKFYQYGSHMDYKFIAMELLGPNMIDIVNRRKPYRFSLKDILKFGIQAIEGLQALHKQGFVHRDIKPGNFVIGNTKDTAGIFYVIDFGLVKKMNMENGVIVKPTKQGGFRGTLRYASLNAHLGLELGRQDDLMSLLYIFIEFCAGNLPWVDCGNRVCYIHY